MTKSHICHTILQEYLLSYYHIYVPPGQSYETISNNNLLLLLVFFYQVPRILTQTSEFRCPLSNQNLLSVKGARILKRLFQYIYNYFLDTGRILKEQLSMLCNYVTRIAALIVLKYDI